MKKLVLFAMSFIMIVVSSFALTGCGCDHEWGEGTVIKSTTCYEAGFKEYICSKCGKTKQENISKIEHDFVLTSSTATCTTSGKDFYACRVCGKEKTYIVDAKGHDYGNVYVCKRCGEVDPSFDFFLFNGSAYNSDAAWVSKDGTARLGVSLTANNGSYSVDFTGITYATYSHYVFWSITVVRKDGSTKDGYTGTVELSLVGYTNFTRSISSISRSERLASPYNSDNIYYINVSLG